MPTSVLLAVLAAAGLLALAPALVRRYDATERLVAERAPSTARVLQRRRRRRTVPGRRPVNPPRALIGYRSVESPLPARSARRSPRHPAARRSGRLRAVPAAPKRSRRRPPPRRRTPRPSYRRRRVLAALLLLNVVELVGVLAGRPRLLDRLRGHRHPARPSTWCTCAVGPSPTGAGAAAEAREAAWLAARQAEVRREQARRAAARREAQRRLAAQREAVRRAAMGLDRAVRPAGGGQRGLGLVPPRRAACAAARTRPAEAPDALPTGPGPGRRPAGLIDSGSWKSGDCGVRDAPISKNPSRSSGGPERRAGGGFAVEADDLLALLPARPV